MSSAPPSDYHDALTELPNRRLFDDRLKQALHLASRRDSGIALLLIELLGFATADDETVREAARRLAPALRKADTLARSGAADEPRCRVATERLLAALDMDVAIGISRFPGGRHYRLYAR